MRQIKLWCSCGTAVVAPESEWGKAHKCPGCTHTLRAPIPDDLGRIAEIFCPVCGEIIRFRPDIPALAVDCPRGHSVRIPLLLNPPPSSYPPAEHDPNKLLIRCRECQKLHRLSHQAAQRPVPCRKCGALLPLPEPVAQYAGNEPAGPVAHGTAQAPPPVEPPVEPPPDAPIDDWLVEFDSSAEVPPRVQIETDAPAPAPAARRQANWRARQPKRDQHPAAAWRRFAAYLIDVVPLMILAGLAVYGPHSRIVQSALRDGRSPEALAVLAQAQALTTNGTFAAYLVYATVLEGLRGATFGKSLLGLRVVRADGTPLGFGRAAARNAAKILSSLCCGLGYLWALVQPEGRAWHDLIAGTSVVAE